MQQYTNEITPEINEAQSQPPYDEELCHSAMTKPGKNLRKLKNSI